MNFRFGMSAFLFFIAALSGRLEVADHAYGQEARLASCGTPGCGTPGCGNHNYGSDGYRNQTDGGGGYQSMPYGRAADPLGETMQLYNSGYSGGYAGGQSMGQGLAGYPNSGYPNSGYPNGGCSTPVGAFAGQTIIDGYSSSYAVGGPATGPVCVDNGVVMAGGGGLGGAGFGGGGAIHSGGFANGLLGNFAPGYYGGFEFLWLRASFGQDVALIIDPPVGNTLVPFDYDNSLSPRAWMGWQSCRGNGVRFSYFGFEDSADPVAVTAVVGRTPVYVNVFGAGSNLTRNATANVGQTLTSRHELNLQAYDIEATQQFSLVSTQAMFGLGVRIADIDQRLQADVVDGAGIAQEAVRNRIEFHGAGPTASLWLTRQIMDSRFSFYSNLRGALLIGETDQRIYEMKGAFTTELEDQAMHREILTNAECSVGLQFGQSLTPRCGAFLRVGYDAQVWLDAGGPVNSDSTIGLDGVAFAMGFAL